MPLVCFISVVAQASSLVALVSILVAETLEGRVSVLDTMRAKIIVLWLSHIRYGTMYYW